MVKGLMLTDRDRNFLYDCYHSGCLTFHQSWQRHFGGNATKTAYNRIQALKEAGYLTSTRVGILLHHGVPKEVGVVYRPTRRAITSLTSAFPRETFRERPLRLNTATLHHDLLLVDIIARLKERFPDQRIVRPALYCGSLLQSKRTPDAMVLDHSEQPGIAIELELTVKSKARYREIILQYRLSQAFQKVVYVVGSEAIAERIRSQITPQKKLPGLPPPSTDRFYFVIADELLRSPRLAPISNGREGIEITFSETN